MFPNNPFELGAWLFLQWYFLPYRLPALMGETDKWVSSVNMNGARWTNLCRPS